MILKVKCYDIVCDRCGKSWSKESETCYPDDISALLTARHNKWAFINDKQFCPDCYSSVEKTGKHFPNT